MATKLSHDLKTTYPIATGEQGKMKSALRERGLILEMRQGRSFIKFGKGPEVQATIAAKRTGEKRPPKRGEWYLSGAEIEAYYAPNDLSTGYHIAELVIVETVTSQKLTDLPTRERWAFSESELTHPEQCRNDDELVATVEQSEVAVMVQRNGKVSNRYADGTRGVPSEIAELVDSVETYGHPTDGGENYSDLEPTAQWKDVVVGADGEFLSFVADHYFEHKAQNDPEQQ